MNYSSVIICQIQMNLFTQIVQDKTRMHACIGMTSTCLILFYPYQHRGWRCFIKSVQGAWIQQCYLDNKINDIINCILSCTLCVQRFIWFWHIITELNILQTNMQTMWRHNLCWISNLFVSHGRSSSSNPRKNFEPSNL